MNIRQLICFSRVYECGSFLKASQSLYVSQQALSRTLAVLEHELNGSLFNRSYQGVSPTPLGTELYRSCQAVLSEMSQLEQHMDEFIRMNYRLLKIGIAAGSRYFNAKSVWNDFLCDHPDTDILAEEHTYRKSMELFEKNEIDVLIFSDFKAPDSCMQYPLKTLERVLLLPKTHPLYQKGTADLSDLDGQSLVLSINDFAYEKLLSLCTACGCRPAEILRVSDTLYMYETCNLDHCIGITISRYFSDIFLSQFSELDIIPFCKSAFPYEISLIARKDHPRRKTILALAAYLEKYLADK